MGAEGDQEWEAAEFPTVEDHVSGPSPKERRMLISPRRILDPSPALPPPKVVVGDKSSNVAVLAEN